MQLFIEFNYIFDLLKALRFFPGRSVQGISKKIEVRANHNKYASLYNIKYRKKYFLGDRFAFHFYFCFFLNAQDIYVI